MERSPRRDTETLRSLRSPVLPGSYRLSLPFKGRTRTFLVYVPTYENGDLPLPLVVNFHGGGSNASQQQRYSGMNATADRHRFIVVYPNGTGALPSQHRLLTFNAGGCCPPATRNQIDDVGFAEAIISTLEATSSIDSSRIFATGMSNGGMMAHRMAAESLRIAAIAPVAGQLNLAPFKPLKPISVIEFHSVDDKRARYDGGSRSGPSRRRDRFKFPSVQAGIDQWVAANGCPPSPSVGQTITGTAGTVDQNQTLTKITYGPGRDESEVILYRLTGAGHVWPGSTTSLPRLLGRPTTLIDANEAMWQFFCDHPST